MKLGLVSVSFRNHSPETIIKKAKEAGLSCIEWGSDIHAPCGDTEKLKKISDLQKSEGLYCSSYGTYFRLGVNDINELTEYFSAAEILGTDIIRVWCGNKGSHEYSENEKAFLINECKAAAYLAEKNNFTLCLECHNNTFTDTKEAAILLMKNINSPAFRMYWQPNQFVCDEDNIAYVRLMSSFTKHIHVFNWKGDKRYKLSESTDLWRRYLSFFNHEKTLLLEFMPDDDIDSLPEEAAALKTIISE